MSKFVYIEVVNGVEGPCLTVDNESGGYRLAGPKPLGGGRTIHKFKVDLDTLIKQANQHTMDYTDREPTAAEMD